VGIAKSGEHGLGYRKGWGETKAILLVEVRGINKYDILGS
jgi:hypothetical protein